MAEEESKHPNSERNRIAITKARKEAKVSQSDLAKRVKVHWITISRLERGLIPVTTDWVYRILRALEADIDGTILYGMMMRGALTAGSIVSSNRVLKDKKSTVALFNTKPFSDEGNWYSIVSMDWEPIARLGDVVRFSKPRTDDWTFAHGRLCLAQGEKKRFVQCGILKTDKEWFEKAELSAYRLEAIDGKVLLTMPFTLVGVATTVMYNSFPTSESGPNLISTKKAPVP